MQLSAIIIFFLALFVPIGCPGEVHAAQGAEFKTIELDGFIKQEQAAAIKGKRTIKMAAPVSFEAKMKRYPEARELSYINQALEISGVRPLPEVKHRMFVESGKGRIIPVYVELKTAAKIATNLKEGNRARFLGYHVFTYAKGPAILVVDFAPLR